MRILLVQKMAGVAGSETYYLNLLPALVARGVEAAFLIVEEPDKAHLNQAFADRLKQAGVDVIRLPCASSLSPRLLRSIASIIRRGRYDLVQSNLIHADVWLSIVKRLLVPNMRLVSAKHGYSEAYQLKHGFDPRFVPLDRFALTTRFAARSADRVVAISEGLANLLAGSGMVDRRKIAVIPYGFTFAAAESSLSPGKARFGSPQIVTVGRLVPVKQHDLLLRAFAGIVAAFPGAKLVIVGGGPEEARLKELAKSLGLDGSVVWTGYVTNPHDYLRDSDLFVIASAAEGFGAVVLEAWHNELPVVAFDVPALNEIVSSNVDGFLIAPFDEPALQSCIVKLLTDSALARRIGARGRESYQIRYTIDAMTSATLDLYRQLIESD
jgi:glycosyltransferase involved in cell wall biosynthesis